MAGARARARRNGAIEIDLQRLAQQVVVGLSEPGQRIDPRIVDEDVDRLRRVEPGIASTEAGSARSSSARDGASTRAPSSSNRSTTARPMPREAPVTKATLPFIRACRRPSR